MQLTSVTLILIKTIFDRRYVVDAIDSMKLITDSFLRRWMINRLPIISTCTIRVIFVKHQLLFCQEKFQIF